MTSMELRLGVVQIAQSWLGVHELTARHKNLVCNPKVERTYIIVVAV